MFRTIIVSTRNLLQGFGQSSGLTQRPVFTSTCFVCLLLLSDFAHQSDVSDLRSLYSDVLFVSTGTANEARVFSRFMKHFLRNHSAAMKLGLTAAEEKEVCYSLFLFPLILRCLCHIRVANICCVFRLRTWSIYP